MKLSSRGSDSFLSHLSASLLPHLSFFFSSSCRSSSTDKKKAQYVAMEIVGKDVQSTLSSIRTLSLSFSVRLFISPLIPSSLFFVTALTEEHKDSSSMMSSVYISSSSKNANLELNYFFESSSLDSTATYDNCTVCVIRPHMISSGSLSFFVSPLSFLLLFF
jgi:hypothetical protein